MNKDSLIKEKLVLKNVICSCCDQVISDTLAKIGVKSTSKRLGVIYIEYNEIRIRRQEILKILEETGFPAVNSRDDQLVEDLKKAMIDLIHHSTYNSRIRNSDYLVERFNLSYQYLTSVFSKHENITLEKYIILLKVEKVKELLDQNEFTLSEIAFMMGYSSVQYLSSQFKNVVGISVSDYKKDDIVGRIPLDKLI